MIRKLFVAGSLLLLFGCAGLEDKIDAVQNGATKNQVIALMGKPDSVVLSEPYEAFTYDNRPVNDSKDRADYIVIFLEQRVIDYGYGFVRQGDSSASYAPNKLFLMPLGKEPPGIPTRN